MWFFGLIVVVLIGAVAVVASGRWGAMSTAYDDRPDMTVPARQVLTSTDIESARFAVGVRGYRMDEVDTLLERVAKEVAERDRRIADLERAVAPIVDTPDGAGFSSRSPYDASDFEDTGPHQPILVGGDFPVSKPADDKPAEVPQVAVPAATAEPTPQAAEPKAESGAAAESPDDDEPETSELPRTRHEAAADEYERLQAEARALLEAQSQPVTPRRTPATPHPAPAQQPPQDEQPPQASSLQSPDQQSPQAAAQQSPQEQAPSASAQQSAQQPPLQASSQQSADAQPAAAEQPTPTLHWTQAPAPQQQSADVQQPQAEQPAPATHWTQAPPPPQEPNPQQASAPQQSDAQQSDAQQGEGEGWRFWPPADQEGEGAYQRPS
ncbi:DivIVA domain-containing protein [Kribbella rubisoli]|uniref:DivIVA domain-containing protein n=1 Tax=Kribbella rubisoli TaxID=3075929 RepID=A0A4Q7X6Q7_9ACTN|nr:DivIVA domain-containing protein [Kribbella rubisoli]RZU18767.1 DivIVA domain-containing protein [Kribbella rubisoli]